MITNILHHLIYDAKKQERCLPIICQIINAVLTEKEFGDFIHAQIKEFVPSHRNLNPFQLMYQFAEFTRQSYINQGERIVKKCFDVADVIFKNGNAVVKMSVENVYVFTLFPTIDKNSDLRKILKGALKDSYEKAIHSSGV